MKPTQKKSETLQVRLPYGLKRDFMARCGQEGQAASEVLRGFIDSYLARPVEILTSEKAAMIRRRFVYPTLALAAAAGAAVVLIPRPGVAGEDLRAAFDAMDLDHDGQLTAQELEPPRDNFILRTQAKAMPATLHRPAPGRTVVGPPRPWAALAQEVIDESDRNGDHRMDLAEYRAFRVGAARLTFTRKDTDHDGRLSRAEFTASPRGLPSHADRAATQARASARFDALDTDHDGFLTPREHTPG